MNTKAPRRGSATASTSSSSSTFNHIDPRDDPLSNPGSPSTSKGKAQRRVSFTTVTTITDPPSVVVVDDMLPKSQANMQTEDLGYPFDRPVTASTDTLPSCNTTSSPSRQTRQPRRPSLGCLESPSQQPNAPVQRVGGEAEGMPSTETSANNMNDSNHKNTHSSTYMQFSQSFPAARPLRAKKSARRRTSLDSCSTFSSAFSSSCYSTGGSLASLLNSKDEAFQRTKLLECIDWLSRHLSRHLVYQLMQQVRQQQQPQEPSQQEEQPSTDEINDSRIVTDHNQPVSFEITKRRASAGVAGSNHSSTITGNLMMTTRPRRHSQPSQFTHPRVHNNAQMNSPTRRSCCFVHCKTMDESTGHDNDDLMEASERRRQQRQIKTQQSLDRMASSLGDFARTGTPSQGKGHNDYDEEGSIDLEFEAEEEEANNHASWPTQPVETNHHLGLGMVAPDYHHASLLFVDISGFTHLSRTLSLQRLSETINAYFQRIVACIHEHGGDVVRFAGDAVMAEWRVERQDENRRDEHNSHTSSVKLATACACQIIERCSDYHVYRQDKAEPKLLATLNVHCGIGYGTLVGLHVGDDTRREYFLFGDAISQAADAIELGREGEVVASPQTLAWLLETRLGTDETCNRAEEQGGPRVVFSSREDRQETTRETHRLCRVDKLSQRPAWISSNNTSKTWKTMLREWDVADLFKLQELMSLYVHPNVVEGELFTSVFHNKGALAAASFDSDSSQSSSSENGHQHQGLRQDQRMQQSEAEIRQVFTVFMQPEVSLDVTGDPMKDETMMKTLNQVMLLANRELARFKGRLRQYIVDDKGVVLIANFGLRGSVFPRMIEEHAMPFAASLRLALQSELNINCRMGATYEKAYCGVVGGVDRHEFAVLGPSVNLAARLMGSKENQGFLVASGVQGEAVGWTFRALEPVKAKGYAEPVPIFEPVMHRRSRWEQPSDCFVGREEELESIMDICEDLLASGCSSGKMVLISASSGFGKSSLMTQAVSQIREKCDENSYSHLFLGQVCCEGDLFRPLSVLGPVLLDILGQTGKKLEVVSPADDSPAIETVHGPAGTALCNSDGAVAVEQFYTACRNADVPSEQIEMIYSLVFNHKWPNPERNEGRHSNMSSQRVSSFEITELVQQVVAVILQATVDLDLVLLGVDNVSLMDEVSWKVIETWYAHGCNLFFVGTSNPVTFKDLNVSPPFWDYLHNEGLVVNRFLHIELLPMGLEDIAKLIAKSAANFSAESERGEFAHEVYLQSGGNPRIAVDMIEKFGGSGAAHDDLNSAHDASHRVIKSVGTIDSDTGSSLAAHVLQKLDSVPATVRTHLNLAALLGESFSAQDVTIVMEKYRGVKAEDRAEHAELVLDSLNDAVFHGILYVESNDSHGYGSGTRFRFTHGAWREKILQLTLDSWRDDILSLVDDTCGCQAALQFA